MKVDTKNLLVGLGFAGLGSLASVGVAWGLTRVKAPGFVVSLVSGFVLAASIVVAVNVQIEDQKDKKEG